MNIDDLNSSIETSLERVNSAVFSKELLNGDSHSSFNNPDWVVKGLVTDKDISRSISSITLLSESLFETTKGFARGCFFGFGLKGGLALIYVILQRKSLSSVLKSVFSRDVLLFTRFVASYVALVRGSNTFLSLYRKKNDRLNAIVAGILGSIAVLLDSKRRRREISLYLFFRAVYVLVNFGVRKEHLPRIPQFKRVIFGVINVPIMYGFLYEPSILQKGYYKWILSMGNITHVHLENTFRKERRFYTSGASRDEIEAVPTWIPYAMSPPMYCLFDWFEGILRAAKIYVPVHFVPLLIFRSKLLLIDPTTTLSRAFVAFAKSCLFLTTYQTAIKVNICWWRYILGYYSDMAAVSAALSTSFACLFEKDSRVTELMLYCCPRSAEGIVELMKLNGFEFNMPLADWFMFAFSSGVLLSASNQDFKPTYFKALQYLIGS